jgi:alanine or glycine:cation symporter, AGCS family
MALDEILKSISDFVWGPAMIVLLVGTGLYLTIRLGFLQFRYLAHSIKCISGKYDRPEEAGEISHFRALAAALSATIGTGNIAGVATAIAMGGPGAVFWMWVTALVGMVTKYASCSLALKYRVIHEDGSASGGPMYFLEQGFLPRWMTALVGDPATRRMGKVLAVSFALFALAASFNIGNAVQSNSVVDGLRYLMSKEASSTPAPAAQQGLDSLSLVVGVVLAGLVGVVILGGIRRIAGVAAKLVPAMCVVYVLAASTILVMFVGRIPESLAMIFRYAFTDYAVGGGVAGAVIAQALRYGVARGVFSNESGLGSAPMAHAAAKTRETAREGFVAMLGPFIDTIIICTLTALVILVTGARDTGLPLGFKGAALTAHAFDMGLAGWGRYVVGIGLILFAYSTMISWSYYGDRCAEYLFGAGAVIWYRCAYVIVVVVGAVGGLDLIWNIADIMNALMAVPNLIGLIALAGVVAKYTKDYTQRLKAGEFD